MQNYIKNMFAKIHAQKVLRESLTISGTCFCMGMDKNSHLLLQTIKEIKIFEFYIDRSNHISMWHDKFRELFRYNGR